MAFDFPNTPAVGDLYPVTPVGAQPQYKWNGYAWMPSFPGGGGGASITVSDAPPTSPSDNALWWESDTGRLHLRYKDVDSSQWVQAAASAADVGAPDAVRYTAQTPVASDQLQARANIFAAPLDAIAFNGMQLNGSMDISQELGAGGTTSVASTYVCDGWKSTTGSATGLAWSTVGSPTTTFPGFSSALFYTVQTAKAALATSDMISFQQNIEGYRIVRLAWGTSIAMPLTIAFWTAHFRPGTYSVSVRNFDGSRSYVTTYMQNVSNAKEYKVITIPGCTDGTWKIDNTIGIILNFGFGCGTTYTAPSINGWLTANYVQAAAQVNAVAATSDVGRITGVVVLPGSDAPSAARSPYIMRPYDQELLLAKRYFETSISNSPSTTDGVSGGFGVMLSPTRCVSAGLWTVRKRATPTFTIQHPLDATPSQIWFPGSASANVAAMAGATLNGWGHYFDFPAGTGLVIGQAGTFHWKADARL